MHSNQHNNVIGKTISLSAACLGFNTIGHTNLILCGKKITGVLHFTKLTPKKNIFSEKFDTSNEGFSFNIKLNKKYMKPCTFIYATLIIYYNKCEYDFANKYMISKQSGSLLLT